jgi:hypothetical protein
MSKYDLVMYDRIVEDLLNGRTDDELEAERLYLQEAYRSGQVDTDTLDDFESMTNLSTY